VNVGSSGWTTVADSGNQPHYDYIVSLRMSHPTENPSDWTRELARCPSHAQQVGNLGLQLSFDIYDFNREDDDPPTMEAAAP
jgi:hypothetical protein